VLRALWTEPDPACSSRGQWDDLVKQLPGHGSREHGVTGGHRAYGGHDLLSRRVLEQEVLAAWSTTGHVRRDGCPASLE
jgi:hypothetical protein